MLSSTVSPRRCLDCWYVRASPSFTRARAGLPVLTANRDEFDLLQQLAPEGRFVHY